MQANHLRPARRRSRIFFRRPRKIFFLIRSAAHLHKSHRKFVAHALNPITNIFPFLVAIFPKLSSRPEKPAQFAGSERRDRGNDGCGRGITGSSNLSSPPAI